MASVAGSSAYAADANPPPSELVVTAQKLDAARQTVEPALGATTYSLSKQLVDVLPGGENVSFNQVILQAPGVVQDSFGQLHIRGDHANIQYRLNNVILPEGIAVFGQTLSPRLAGNIDLVTGALPAQYGLRTAGIINITTKSGFQSGGEVGVYGGSHATIEPSFEYGGSWGANSAFVSGSFLHTGVGIESPDGSATPLHDRSNQLQLFGFFDHIIDPSDRISLIAGTSQQTFQIPNRQGLHPDFPNDPSPTLTGAGLVVNGQGDFLSNNLVERQREGTTFAIVSYQHTTDRFTGQASLFSRYSTLTFHPDPLGDLLFTGIAQDARKSDTAVGLQLEGVYNLTLSHTLRGGVIVQGDRGVSKTNSQVLPVDGSGMQTTDVPLTIIDNGAKTAWTYSAYLQDELKLLPQVTINFGVRYDRLQSYRTEDQWSPRVNAVWTPFNYQKGYIRGVEFSSNVAKGPFSAYVNLALNKAQGKTIDSAQANFDPGDLAYIATNYIYLDHIQAVTVSAGASYRFGDTHLSTDLLFGSGLRRDGAVPNGDHVPSYTQVNVSISHDFANAPVGPITLRLDMINAFDEIYEIRDGTGVGVGAPQFGPRRGVFVGLTKSF